MARITRRRMLQAAGGAALSTAFGGSLWRSVLSAPGPVSVGSRYGPLGAADDNGMRLPARFTGRIVGRSGDHVAGTTHPWHAAPDGGGCFATAGGGWRYASNAEVGAGGGGVSVIEFGPQAEVTAAYPILSGTSRNCAGGVTPWGTWFSCEERGSGGHVWECDPGRAGQGIRRPALGAFNHEAAVVDAVTGAVYLTEDAPDGRLYRFVPATPGDVSAGVLQAAVLDGDPTAGPAGVTWHEVAADRPDRSVATAPFNGGEGAWIHADHLLFTTKGNRRVWELSLRSATVEVLHDCGLAPHAPLDAVDNVVVHHRTGDIFVAEDGGNMELCSIERRADGSRRVGTFLRLEGQDGSEITGPAFTPAGDRLYVSSQRGPDGRGITYEVTGPFSGLIRRGASGELERARRIGVTGASRPGPPTDEHRLGPTRSRKAVRIP